MFFVDVCQDMLAYVSKNSGEETDVSTAFKITDPLISEVNVICTLHYVILFVSLFYAFGFVFAENEAFQLRITKKVQRKVSFLLQTRCYRLTRSAWKNSLNWFF